MERFFDVVPSNFFNVLSRKNKNLYADCIINLYKAIVNESNMLITKTNAYSIMDQIMSYYSETGELEEFDVPYADTIRMLEKAGWFYRDFSDKLGEEYFSFTDTGLKFAQAMVETTSNEFITAGEHWKNVVASLESTLNGENPYSALVSAEKESMTLAAEYTLTDNQIRKISDELQKSVTAGDIYSNIEKMNNEFTHGRIKKIKEESLNPLNVNEVESLIDKIRYNNEIRRKIVKTDISGSGPDETQEKIDVFLDNIYRRICENSSVKIHAMGEMINRYLDLAIRHLRMALTSSEDINGVINKIAKSIINGTDIPNILPDAVEDYQGPYRPRTISDGKQEEIPEDTSETTEIVKRTSKKTEVCEKILKMLKEKEFIESEEFDKETFEEFQEFVLSQVTGLDNPAYYTEFTGEQVDNGIVHYPKTVIRRKNGNTNR